MPVIRADVRFANNAKELAANIKEGVAVLDVMKSSVDRTAASLGGNGLFGVANKLVVAIQQLGGVQKLTSAEAEKYNAILDKAIQKAEVVGRAVPDAWREIAAQTKAAAKAADENAESHSKLNEVVRLNLPTIAGFSTHISENIALLGGWGAAIGGAFVAFEVGKHAIEIGEQVAEDAKALRNLSNETRVGVVPLQVLGAALKDFGVTNEDVGRGIYQLGRRIAGDDQSAAAALTVLGLKVKDLKALAPDQMFLSVVKAVNQLPDPLERSRIVADLFGAKFGQALLAVGPELDEIIAKVKTSSEIMGEDAVHAAAQFADSVDHLKLSFKAMLGEALAPALKTLAEFIDKQRELQRQPVFLPVQRGPEPVFTTGNAMPGENLRPSEVRQIQATGRAPLASRPLNPAFLTTMPAATEQAVEALSVADRVLKQLREDYVPLTSEQRKFLADVVRIGGAQALTTETVKRGAQSLGITTDQLRRFEEQTRKAITAGEQFDKAVANIDALTEGTDWDGTIDGLLKLGASVHDVALYFGEAEGAIEKQKKALEDAAADDRALAESEREEIAETQRQYNEYVAEKLKALEKTEEAVGKAFEMEAHYSDRLAIGNETAADRVRLAWKKALDDLQKEFDKAGPAFAGAFANAGQQINQSFAAELSLASMADAVKAAGQKDADAFTKGFSTLLKDIPDVLARAFEGGGGVQGAARSLGLHAGALIADEFVHSGVGQKVADGLGKAFHVKTAEGAGALVSGLQGLAAGGIGALIDFGLNKLLSAFGPSKQELEGRGVEAQFQKQFGTFDQMLKAVSAAYQATGRGAVMAEADVRRLMAAEKEGAEATQTAVDQINKAFQQQQQQLSDLQQAIDTYNFSEKELGTTVEQLHLDERADKLAGFITSLLNFNVPMETIIKRMGGDLNKLVQDAIKYGLTLPSALRPILDMMAAEGKLTVNGRKVASVDELGLSFEDSASTAMSNLIIALDNLTRALGGNPDNGKKKDKGKGDGAGTGGNTSPEPPALGTGAFVRWPMVATVGDAPGGEYVIPAATMGAWFGLANQMAPSAGWINPAGLMPHPLEIGMGASGGLSPAPGPHGGGGVSIIHHHQWDLRGALVYPDAHRKLARAIEPHLARDLAENKGSFGTKMRGGLGVPS